MISIQLFSLSSVIKMESCDRMALVRSLDKGLVFKRDDAGDIAVDTLLLMLIGSGELALLLLLMLTKVKPK